MQHITLTLPLPDARLSANARVHWRQKSKLVREHRQLANVLASHQFQLQRPKVKGYKLRFVWPDKRRRDKDNASSRCKSYLDGVADYLRQDDSEWEFYGVEFADPDKPRVEFEFTVKQ